MDAKLSFDNYLAKLPLPEQALIRSAERSYLEHVATRNCGYEEAFQESMSGYQHGSAESHAYEARRLASLRPFSRGASER